MESKTKLEEYINLLNEIKTRVEDEHTAVRILAEISKDRRMQEMHEQREQQNNKPASQKQLAYLSDLGVDVSEHPALTSKKASELIDEALRD